MQTNRLDDEGSNEVKKWQIENYFEQRRKLKESGRSILNQGLEFFEKLKL